MPKPSLAWLTVADDFNAGLKRLQQRDGCSPGSLVLPENRGLPETPDARWQDLVALSRLRLDFLRTDRLDVALRREYPASPGHAAHRPVRLALLGSSTVAHLAAPIRVAGLRRNIHVTILEGEYGQYRQELEDVNRALRHFRPDTVLLALDARHLTGGLDPRADHAAAQEHLGAVVADMRQCWRLAHDLGATVIQQAALPVLPGLVGNNEQRLPGSPACMLVRLNVALREAADADRVHVLAVDEAAARDGIVEWHDPLLWHRTRQEDSPVAAPVYGDLVGRLLAARQGRSAKCLALDLDNTLWGGAVAEDGLADLVLGHGSALGEAHLAVQQYAWALAQRGVLLAICCDTDEASARAAFEGHPEMLLRWSDIAAFAAGGDKPGMLLRIAEMLGIGLDSLVLLDDSVSDRSLVRAALPDVAVPEVPDDEPALMPAVLAAAGYFESLAFHADDLEAPASSEGATLTWRRFDRIALQRIVHLFDRTSSFNLTTRRTKAAEIQAIIDDPDAIGLQLRLRDGHGDHGIIAAVVGRVHADGVCRIESWLMSCRVLGRGVEVARLALLVAQARARGSTALRGEYIPSGRNGMVSTHYGGLGFSVQAEYTDGGHVATLDLAGFVMPVAGMAVVEGA